MKLDKKKRMAAKVLGVGYYRVWIDPERSEDVSTALTRADMRRLIKEGTIQPKQKLGVSRGRTRERLAKRRKGRHRGHGSRKGTAAARFPRKERWIKTIRPVRRRLSELKKQGTIEPSEYRKLYRMAKGGAFRSKGHLETYLKEKGILKV
jgi:large subunit ribosomal protein L19e